MKKKCKNFTCEIFATHIKLLVFINLTICCLACGIVEKDKAVIILETDYFEYSITGDGNNLHFKDKSIGIDYLDADTISKCAWVSIKGTKQEVTKVSLNENRLTMEFGDRGIKAELEVIRFKDWISLKVTSVTGEIESLNFLNVPLKLVGQQSEPFAACVLSMNLQTHVRQVPALMTHLSATCYKRFGMKEARVSIIGVPMGNILPTIREIMMESKDLPYSLEGGAWAQMSKEGYGSYLLNYGSLTEETVDEWIEMCSSVGFNQIDNHGGNADFFKFGSFELDKEKWPDGWDDFRRINDRLHKAGISSLFHTYVFFIDKDSKYVTPIPSKDLDYYKSFTIAKAIGPEDSEIVVQESTKGISAVTGFHVSNSRTIRIGNELVEFDGVTENSPYKFTGCRRGVNETIPLTHKVGSKAFHLKEQFGRFVPGPETELFDKIAHETAEIVNRCNFDGIYFDAIDGSSILAGSENSWYYGTKFILEVAKHLNPIVGMEMSSMENPWWHYRSRWQAWDVPRRGFKRFVDIHATSINGGMLLPLQLGWWLNFTWSPPNTERTFPDDIEYLCCKMVGNNAGLALLGGVEEKEIAETPSFKRLNKIIKQYEELNHKNIFGENIKKLLRQPGREYTLFQERNGGWNFKPVTYEKHRIFGVNQPSSRWLVENKFNSQPIKLRIESLMSVKSYDDPANVYLTDFSNPGEFTDLGTANGVSGNLVSSDYKTIKGETTGIFTAENLGKSPQNGSWICVEKKFEPQLDLTNHEALGVWIKGDGNGEILDFRLCGPFNLSYGVNGGHFVKIDFRGWRYFELLEIESSGYTDYLWPNVNVYNSHHFSLDFKGIDKLQLWYNNLAPGKKSSCVIGPVKAIPTTSGTIKNPSIKIGEEKITFQVTLDSGMYIEFQSAEDCKLYGSRGEFIKDVPIQGKVPILKNGENDISFSCNSLNSFNPRLEVTMISEGSPLIH